MSRILVLSVILGCVSTIVGCGASTRSSVTPVRDEACWTAPEEVAMQIREETRSPEGVASDEHLKCSYRPNRQERPVAGAIHAAAY